MTTVNLDPNVELHLELAAGPYRQNLRSRIRQKAMKPRRVDRRMLATVTRRPGASHNQDRVAAQHTSLEGLALAVLEGLGLVVLGLVSRVRVELANHQCSSPHLKSRPPQTPKHLAIQTVRRFPVGMMSGNKNADGPGEPKHLAKPRPAPLVQVVESHFLAGVVGQPEPAVTSDTTVLQVNATFDRILMVVRHQIESPGFSQGLMSVAKSSTRANVLERQFPHKLVRTQTCFRCPPQTRLPVRRVDSPHHKPVDKMVSTPTQMCRPFRSANMFITFRRKTTFMPGRGKLLRHGLERHTEASLKRSPAQVSLGWRWLPLAGRCRWSDKLWSSCQRCSLCGNGLKG